MRGGGWEEEGGAPYYGVTRYLWSGDKTALKFKANSNWILETQSLKTFVPKLGITLLSYPQKSF